MSQAQHPGEGSRLSSIRRYTWLLLGIFVLALIVRGLTGHFMREHFDDTGWFQYGSYAAIERNATDILDGKAPIFWIDDATRTDRIQYPPGQALWIAFIYKITGDRSPASILRVQIVLDSLSVFLLAGIGVSAFGWRSGLAAGFLAALSPLLALIGVTPTGDALASWLVLAGAFFLIIAAKRESIVYAIAAGALLGASCWLRVNPLFMTLCWAAAIFVFLNTVWRRRMLLASAIVLATLIVISPVVVRNLVVFYPEVAPTGLNIGWNLLAGIGETERGAEFGAPCCDADIVQQEREALGLPPEAPLGLTYPDGIRRDRERGRRALAIIAEHPIWFAGVAARRTAAHLKFFGPALAPVGSQGINVTPSKTLRPEWQGGVTAVAVTVLGMVQSVWRYLALPMMLVGVFLAFRIDRVSTWLLLSSVVYYLATLAIGHSETRYGLPMQAILIVFAGVAVSWIIEKAGSRSSHRGRNDG